MKKTIVALVALVMLAGCGYSVEQAKILTEKNLKNKPELVGVTGDGQSVYRYVIPMPNLQYNHYVYRFGDLPTETVNYEVSVGKSTQLQVLVIVGNKTNTFEVEK